MSEVTEQISTNFGHIFTYDCYLKKIWSKLSPGIYPSQAGGKKRFSDRHWTLTEHICATEHDINNRKETCQLTGTRLHAAKFGELWSRNVKERLASFCPHPLNFHTASFTSWTLYNRQQANYFGMCYVVARAYSLEQQNAGRVHAGLCHASSCICCCYYCVYVCGS